LKNTCLDDVFTNFIGILGMDGHGEDAVRSAVEKVAYQKDIS
jgi:hypothetical protein